MLMREDDVSWHHHPTLHLITSYYILHQYPCIIECKSLQCWPAQDSLGWHKARQQYPIGQD